MSTTTKIIRYSYVIGEQRINFKIDTSDTASPCRGETNDCNLPDWTRLDHEQCPCCPLKTETHKHCPAAVRMHEVLETFKSFKSIERVNLTVETSQRSYIQDCDLQSGLNSMLGLLMATSGCPLVGKLKAMATFHLPLSTFGETLFRSVGAYLIKQYFAKQNGKEPDWELKGLKQFYGELEQVNQAFSERIRSIDRSDAIINAMVIFFATSMVVTNAIEEGLKDYEDYFTGTSIDPPEDG